MVKLHLEHQYELMKDPQVREIMKNGYVLNARLYRRWIPMQFFRLYENCGSVQQMYGRCGSRFYGDGAPYSITKKFRLWCEEIYRLSVLYENDHESYQEYVDALGEDMILRAGTELLDMMNPHAGDTYIDNGGRECKISGKRQESNTIAIQLRQDMGQVYTLDKLFGSGLSEGVLLNIKKARSLRKQNLNEDLTFDDMAIPNTGCWDKWYLNTGAYYTLKHITTFMDVDSQWVDWDTEPINAFEKLVYQHPEINNRWYAQKMTEVFQKQEEYREKGKAKWDYEYDDWRSPRVVLSRGCTIPAYYLKACEDAYDLMEELLGDASGSSGTAPKQAPDLGSPSSFFESHDEIRDDTKPEPPASQTLTGLESTVSTRSIEVSKPAVEKVPVDKIPEFLKQYSKEELRAMATALLIEINDR